MTARAFAQAQCASEQALTSLLDRRSPTQESA